MQKIRRRVRQFKEQYPLIYQFAGFTLVGTSGLAVMLLTYYTFLWLGFSKQIANFAGFFTSTAYSYLLNFVWVFNGKAHSRNSALKFFTLYFLLYLFSAWLLHIIVDILHISEYLAPFINAMMITPPSFLGSKYWVFRGERGRKAYR